MTQADFDFDPRGVRFVLFDAVGTLLHADPPVGAVYAAHGQRYGVPIDVGTARERFLAAFARDERGAEADWTTSGARERQRWRGIVERVFPGVARADALFEELWQHFARAEHWRVDPQLAHVAQQLVAGGYELGLASNFDERLLEVRAAHPQLAAIEHVFVSAQLGYRKPSAEFFRQIERRLGAGPEELLLVGDDLRNDYQAARTAGWRALLLDRQGREPTSQSIAELGQLPALLTRARRPGGGVP